VTALLIIGIIVVICLTATSIVVAVTSRQSVSDAFLSLDRSRVDYEKSLSKVLDRLMTIRWEDFAAVQASADDEEGGFITPADSDNDDTMVDDGKWGRMSTLRERLHLLDEEEALVDEDFDEHGEPRRTGV
jgi:hypothetical protein